MRATADASAVWREVSASSHAGNIAVRELTSLALRASGSLRATSSVAGASPHRSGSHKNLAPENPEVVLIVSVPPVWVCDLSRDTAPLTPGH